jgi:hypothetical protein
MENGPAVATVIPEGAGRVNGGFLGFWPWWACVTSVSCFPVTAMSVGDWLGMSRTGRSPAAVAARRRP